MNYAKDYKNDNHYVSVNTLIKPQRKPNLSVVSNDATVEQQEPVQTADVSLPVMPRQDTLLNPDASAPVSQPNNLAEHNIGQVADQVAPAVGGHHPGRNHRLQHHPVLHRTG